MLTALVSGFRAKTYPLKKLNETSMKMKNYSKIEFIFWYEFWRLKNKKSEVSYRYFENISLIIFLIHLI